MKHRREIGDAPQHSLSGNEDGAIHDAIDREYQDLLDQLTDDTPRPHTLLTNGQDFINDLFGDQQIDQTVYAAVKAAAMHLNGDKGMTAEQVGQLLIDGLRRDLDKLAENNAEKKKY